MSKQQEIHTAYTVAEGLDLTLQRWSLLEIILEARVDGLFWRMLWKPPRMAEDVIWEMEGTASISQYELLLHSDVIIHTEYDEALWDAHRKSEYEGWMKTPAWKFEHDNNRYHVADNSKIVDTYYPNELAEITF